MNIRNFRYEEDIFSKNAQGIIIIFHGLLLLMKLSQTKSQIKKMKINYYVLYYRIIKNRDEKEIVKDKNEKK